MAQHVAAFEASQLWQYWITRTDAPEHVIGQCQVSLIARGVFQNASLGYSLAQDAQGQGYMQEALRCLINELFSPRVWLHRLEAAVRPDNIASLRVMERLGFRQEGLCKDYLYIHGAWHDHQRFAMLNPAWGPDQAPIY
ncbi:ribosomal-protein-alanine N-acetyltransferase [Roseateles sp. YR242]|nr:ribosomal-protein-alanine N-acetyltransferase [Roseateles sp. YR242]